MVALLSGSVGAAGGVSLARSSGLSTSSPTYLQLARDAVRTLEDGFYDQHGEWHLCLPHVCDDRNQDWGADALTYALYLHWSTTHDPSVRPIMAALARTAKRYSPSVRSWSDIPLWDSVADVREYQVTHAAGALAKAEAAFRYVSRDRARVFAAGACPAIDYQAANGGRRNVKTLETDSNYIKAALLLWRATGARHYLTEARTKYVAVRRSFFQRHEGLYTVYVYDDGHSCHRLDGRYFASVNGNMIWAGLHLAAATGIKTYGREAVRTARAVSDDLSDASGVYADLQTEYDVVEPLIEAMYQLATSAHQAFARRWLLTAAAQAADARASTGAYGRFFDGPAPHTTTTAWQANGGLALMVTAGALAPRTRVTRRNVWAHSRTINHERRLSDRPVRLAFTGRAVAILGPIGEPCCQRGHARIFVDGTQTFDRTGVWQNKSSGGRRIRGTVLFAWRWLHSGRHRVVIRPGKPNPKEGGSYFHMTGYVVVP
jgi:hypothetical protein